MPSPENRTGRFAEPRLVERGYFVPAGPDPAADFGGGLVDRARLLVAEGEEVAAPLIPDHQEIPVPGRREESGAARRSVRGGRWFPGSWRAGA